jgi:lipid A ethanolaminephosphotransferase
MSTIPADVGVVQPAADSSAHESPAPTRLGALRIPRGRLGTNSLLLIVALYLSTTQNHAFWHQVWRVLPVEHGTSVYGLLGSLFVAINVLLLTAMAPLSARRIVKPVLVLFLITAAVCSYFMDSFGVVIDESMIVNAMQTDAREAGELLSVAMLLHVLLFGVVPAVLVARVELVGGAGLRELGKRCLLVLLALGALLTCVLANYKSVSLWARTNRHVRMYVNPTYPMHALGRQVVALYKAPDAPPLPIANDAVRLPAVSGKPRVVVMVIGETARAANFQLAGYERATNPELSKIGGVVSFNQLWSCGTATAVSVPCMFSRLHRTSFSRSKARKEENVLDVLHRTGVAVSWRDNNSDSKGVAARLSYEDFRRRKLASLCDAEDCHDEILLEGLDDLLASTTGDRIVVLHLLGSHGPSYYKRYPPEFRKFVPDCAQDDVQGCSRETIVNAYDNTMLYTDHVLAKLIRMLERHQDQVEPTMVYMSDHGESLGETGIYLHGLPYAVAPEEQTHVPGVIWSPSHDLKCVQARRMRAYSHDNLFPTLLGLFSVQTSEYHMEDDMLGGCGEAAAQ